MNSLLSSPSEKEPFLFSILDLVFILSSGLAVSIFAYRAYSHFGGGNDLGWPNITLTCFALSIMTASISFFVRRNWARWFFVLVSLSILIFISVNVLPSFLKKPAGFHPGQTRALINESMLLVLGVVLIIVVKDLIVSKSYFISRRETGYVSSGFIFTVSCLIVVTSALMTAWDNPQKYLRFILAEQPYFASSPLTDSFRSSFENSIETITQLSGGCLSAEGCHMRFKSDKKIILKNQKFYRELNKAPVQVVEFFAHNFPGHKSELTIIQGLTCYSGQIPTAECTIIACGNGASRTYTTPPGMFNAWLLFNKESGVYFYKSRWVPNERPNQSLQRTRSAGDHHLQQQRSVAPLNSIRYAAEEVGF
ncbi:MAG: hypothetical protein KCHDKBKB_01917 [Elusimicrobia bacterium]|nr:hypothetical protein [Elusimicrobiota bacterium]